MKSKASSNAVLWTSSGCGGSGCGGVGGGGGGGLGITAEYSATSVSINSISGASKGLGEKR